MNKPFAILTAEPEETVTPNTLLEGRYPGLSEVHGPAFDGEVISKKRITPVGSEKVQVWLPTVMNERYFAALLTPEANKVDPAVYDRDEKNWYRYNPTRGIYSMVIGEELHEALRRVLLELVRECEKLDAPVDVGPLGFKFRRTAALTPVVTAAIASAAVSSEYWERPPLLVPVRNGIYSIEENVLSKHSPTYHFRGLIEADYDPAAECPRWMDFLEQVLVNEDDRVLLQKVFGLLMVGANIAQVMVLMFGAAQSGKGTIARIMTRLIGPENTALLRTSKLEERFELGRLRHKLLLYGPDVSQDFLNVSGAHLLKAITGEDPISPEYKNSNAVPAAKPIHGLPVVTCNSRLRIRFEGDKAAWQRRLVVLHFDRAVPESQRVDSLSEKIMGEEGSGVLNWAIAGIRRLAADRCKLNLTDRQRQVRDSLLDESESYVAFAREWVCKDEVDQLTSEEAWKAYVEFCTTRAWAPVTQQMFGTGFNRAVIDIHGVTRSNDLKASFGKVCRGWHGLKVIHRRFRRQDLE